MRNYFKAIGGDIAPREGHHGLKKCTLQEALYFFDDASPESVGEALFNARHSFPRAAVSVWRRAQTVPSGVPEIGEMAAHPDLVVLQPGQKRPGQRVVDEDVDGVLDFVGSGLMAAVG